MRASLRIALALVAVLALAGPEAALAGPDPSGQCFTADPPAIDEPAHPLRFGTSPEAAGTVGSSQGEVDPVDVDAQDAALNRLEPPRRTLVIRLSRMFMSDGRQAIASLARRARHFTKQGFKVEAQVRYHPNEEQEGRMGLWREFVRQAVRKLGRNDDLVALTITNEVNLPLSPNTSDGAFEKAVKAILVGLPTARHTLHAIGREDVALGFSYAYRYVPEEDNKFWQRLGDEGTPRFRRAVDYVGLQLYPGLFWPPTLVTQTAGEATVEAMTLLRQCWMPRAKLEDSARIWITENGYATNLGHTEERQQAELADTVERVHEYSGELGVTDYRYFNFRDNRPNGTDLFDDVGLLRSDYSRKPAFGTYRELVGDLGR